MIVCLQLTQRQREIFFLILKKPKKKESVIIVSHKISSVMHADLILVLDKGIIVEKGTHNQLLSIDGFYKKLAQKQLIDIDLIKI